MNYHKIEKTSIANGEGIRVVLWCSGCSLHCRGCQNPATWDINSGKLFDEEAKKELFEALDKSYIKGITLSGGHPLEEENLKCIFNLIIEIKDKFPSKDIWLYTGYTLKSIFYPVVTDDLNCKRDEIINLRKQIVEMCDIVVDGAFIEEQKDITLKFRGSKNQRVIDIKESLKQGEVILWTE